MLVVEAASAPAVVRVFRFWSPVKPILLTLLAFVASAVQAVTVSWTPPTTNVDATPLTNLAGYRILYGPSTALTGLTSIQVPNPGLTRYTVDLPPGTWYIRMHAYNSAGGDSVLTPASAVTVAGPPPPPPPPPVALLTSGTLAYELRSATNSVSMVAIGLIPAGQPCGPEIQTVTNVKYCRIQRSQMDTIAWPTDLKLQSIWARAAP